MKRSIKGILEFGYMNDKLDQDLGAQVPQKQYSAPSFKILKSPSRLIRSNIPQGRGSYLNIRPSIFVPGSRKSVRRVI
jgi:hypothetical protein